MKKLFGLLVILFVMYLSLQVLFAYIGSGHSVDYEISDNNNLFKIHEDFNSNNKKDDNNYSLNINIDNTKFDVLTYHDFKRSSKIIKDIKYYSDNSYKCIFLRYRDNVILHDVLCNNGKYTTYYSNMSDSNEELEKFITSLTEYNYNKNQFMDNTTNTNVSTTGTIYLGNIIRNHFVGIINGKSLYRINNIDKIKVINLFSKKNITFGAFTNDKYVFLDGSDTTNKTYKIYSFTSSKNYSVVASNPISNPILLGTYGGSAFIYDKENGIEYEINTESKNMLEVGNNDTSIKYYSNGNLEHKKIDEIDFNNLNFGNEYENDYANPNFDKTIKIGNKYGYYYYFKKVNDYYETYRSRIDDKDNITYLFKTTNIEKIEFNNNYIYYMDNNTLKYYSDLYGNRSIMSINNINSNYMFKVFIDKTKEA